MTYSRLLIRGEPALLFQLILTPFAMAGGLIFSPLNLNHPCYIVFGFLIVNCVLQLASYAYHESFDEVGMKTNLFFGFLKILTGSILITGAIMSSVWFGLALVPVFYILGAINLARGVSQWQEKMYEKRIAERVKELEQRVDSRNVRATAKTLALAVQQVEMEKALLADLTVSLRDLDSKDGQEN